MRGLIINLFLNNASQGLQFASRWVVNLFLLTVLSTSDFADFTFVYALANILLSIYPFGSSAYIINIKEDNKKVFLKSINIINVIFLISLIIYCFVFFIFRQWEALNFIWLGLFLAYILSLNYILFSYFKSVSVFIKELNSYLIFTVVLLLSFLILSYFNLNIYTIFLVFFISNLITFIYASRKIFSFSQLINTNQIFNFKDLFFNLNQRLYFGFQEIVTAVYTQGGMLILYYLLTNEDYKTYKALFIIVAPFFMFSVAFSQVMLNQMKNIKVNRLSSFFRKTQIIMLLLSLLMSFILFIFKEFIFFNLKIDLSNENLTSFYLIILILNTRFVFTNYEIIFIVLDKQSVRFYIVLISAIFSIIAIFVFVPLYGLFGAVFVFALSYLIVLIGLVLQGEKILMKNCIR